MKTVFHSIILFISLSLFSSCVLTYKGEYPPEKYPNSSVYVSPDKMNEHFGPIWVEPYEHYAEGLDKPKYESDETVVIANVVYTKEGFKIVFYYLLWVIAIYIPYLRTIVGFIVSLAGAATAPVAGYSIAANGNIQPIYDYSVATGGLLMGVIGRNAKNIYFATTVLLLNAALYVNHIRTCTVDDHTSCTIICVAAFVMWMLIMISEELAEFLPLTKRLVIYLFPIAMPLAVALYCSDMYLALKIFHPDFLHFNISLLDDLLVNVNNIVP